MKRPRPNDGVESFCQWFIITMALMWTLGLLLGQPAYEFERISEYRDRVCAAKLPPIEKLGAVRGVVAAGKEDDDRCAFIERSKDADRDDVLRRVGRLIEAERKAE